MLLKRLIDRGDRVSIDQGRLLIDPVSGRDVCEQWMQNKREKLVVELATMLGRPLFSFTHHITAVDIGRSNDRVTLNFIRYPDYGAVVQHYNCCCRYTRKAKGHNPGDKLQPGRFVPPANGSFVRFYKQCGLEMPRKLSEFYGVMGRLRPIIFVGEVEQKAKTNRFTDKSIDLLSASYQELISRGDSIAESQNEPLNSRQLTGKSSPIERQIVANKVCQENPSIAYASSVYATSGCVSHPLRTEVDEQSAWTKEHLAVVNQSSEEWEAALGDIDGDFGRPGH